MANTSIQLKKSGVSGNTPSNLLLGELGINYADGILFYKNDVGAIKTIKNTNSFSTVNANSSLLLATSPDDILSIVGNNAIKIQGNISTDTITIDVNNASLTQKGVVQLYDGVDSGSITLAATASAVNTAYALAFAAFNSGGGGGGNNAILTTNYKTQEYVASNNQTNFGVTNGYIPEYIAVHVNGVLLDSSDYTATDGLNVVLNTGTSSGDYVSISKWYFDNSLYLSASQQVDEFNATAGQTTFTTSLSYTAGYIKVYKNGLLLESTDYTASGGTSVVLNSPASLNDNIAIEYWGASSINATPIFILANDAYTLANSVSQTANAAYIAANSANANVSSKLDKLEFADFTSNNITTSANTANQILDLFSTSTFRSAKYIVQVTSSTDYQVSEILLIHNGTNSFLTEYSLVTTNGVLMNYDTDINSGNARLLMNPVNSVNTIKIVKTLVEV